MVSTAVTLAGILFIALAPPVAYLAWVRGIERHDREPVGALAKVFLWGAVAGVAISAALEAAIGFGIAREYSAVRTGVPMVVIMAVIVAPVVEEAAKPLGLRFVGRALNEVEDGLVYGAAAGFGFAATENLLYEYQALTVGGVGAFVVTVLVRSVAAVFLHGAATSLTGYAFARGTLEGHWGALAPYFLAAVAAHALYNLLAAFQTLLGLVGAVVFALWVFGWTRRKLRELDRRGAPVVRGG